MSENSTPTEPSSPPRKLQHVDNYRSYLTALVILHHTSTSYGGAYRNYYQSSFHAPGSSAALVGFNALNQTFFMGTFMFVAGYFSRRAVARKGPKKFTQDRLYRLGLPTVAYTLIGAPITAGLAASFKGESVGLRWVLAYLSQLRGTQGPVWFTATLLCFDVSLAAIQAFREKPESEDSAGSKSERISPWKLFGSLALCSAADFFVRLAYPVGRKVQPLNIQPAYLSQFIAAYALGACLHGIDVAIPNLPATCALLLASIASGRAVAKGVAGGTSGIQKMAGGWNETAAAYAFWNNVTGYLLGVLGLAIFKKLFTTSWGRINEVAFPAFLVHLPVITALGIVTDKWQAGSVTKTVVVGGAGVICSWIVGHVGDRLWHAVRGTGKAAIRKEND